MIGVPSAVFFYTLVPPPSSLRSGFKNKVFLCGFVPNMSLLEMIHMENAVSKPLDGEEASFFSSSAVRAVLKTRVTSGRHRCAVRHL